MTAGIEAGQGTTDKYKNSKPKCPPLPPHHDVEPDGLKIVAAMSQNYLSLISVTDYPRLPRLKVCVIRN
jgi:hypothetical protein